MRAAILVCLVVLVGSPVLGIDSARAEAPATWLFPALRTGAVARLGVSLQPLTAELREYFAAPPGQGVLVASVSGGSAAAHAGLRAGDVIVAVDGSPVGAPGDVMREIVPAPAGASVDLAMLREQEPMTVSVKLDGEPSAYFDPLDRRSWQGFGERMGERMYDYMDHGRAALLRRLEELERRLEELERDLSAEREREI